MCPYSHELTHGVILGVAGLYCLARYHDERRLAWIAALGLALGLLVLTKVEALVAGGAAIAVGLALTLAIARPGRAATLRVLGVLAAAAAAAVTVALFVRVLPAAAVLAGPLGQWRAAFALQAAHRQMWCGPVRRGWARNAPTRRCAGRCPRSGGLSG